MDLFTRSWQEKVEREGPLAVRMRPCSLEEFVGQEEILKEGAPLYRAITEDKMPSCLFYGPPGTGKTTLARIIASFSSAAFVQLNAVSATVKEVREVIKQARERWGGENRRTILFLDEIHRFNKAQQDALLSAVEEGTLLFIGATTENPFFHLTSPLLSRLRIFSFHPLEKQEVKTLLQRSLEDSKRGLGEWQVEVEDKALELLSERAGGDARAALNSLELAVQTAYAQDGQGCRVTYEVAEEAMAHRVFAYDRSGDAHYDIASAFIKSIRGSDPDAALYWLARMIQGGEDPLFIARRLVISASEDVGNADPRALEIANAAAQGVQMVGMPEGKIILAQAVTYLASAPKSNASYLGINEAMEEAKKHAASPVPDHIKGAGFRGAERLGHGKGYRYPHDYREGYVRQRYLPPELEGRMFYRPKEIGLEGKIKQRLEKLHPRRHRKAEPNRGE